jgi:uncharacterized repeat protein (TIGR03803 family)
MPLRRQHLQRCLAVLCLVVLTFSAARSYAQSTTTLYTFTGGADGGNPKSTLSMDPAGNLYGTTTTGGGAGNGTVFKIDTSQIFSVIHSFGADEGHPIYGLVMDSSGNLYGTTYNGGASDLGTIFKIDTSSNYSVLHDFDGAGGSNPYGPLVVDTTENLFGTASSGGTAGLGTVFELDASNNYSVLHNFAGGSSDGSTPYGGLVLLPSSGILYGTTFNGGVADAGTIFTVDQAGDFVLKYTFTGGSDGGNPVAGPVVSTDYTVYVSASTGGYAGSSYGTILKYDTSGGYPWISFAGGSDGATPYAAPILDADGRLYGTTFYGGASNGGTLFGPTSQQSYSVLYSFTSADGINPGGLLLDTKGNLYGVTTNGGSLQYGTVYKFATTAKITAPADHTVLNGSTVNFTWLPEGGATSYQIWLGSTAGTDDLGYLGTSDTAATFTTVPTDGRVVYATLYGYANNTWSVQDTAIYQAATASKAHILSPGNGTMLPGSTVTFTWSAETGGASYQLWLGSTPGTYDLGVVGTSNLQGTLTNLPTDGRNVYATLWGYDASGTWSVQDTASYLAAYATKAVITSPAKGSTFTGLSMNFTWTAETGATSYQLWVGYSPGQHDITYVETTGLSATVSGLPRTGVPVYVTLWGYSGGTWSVQDTGNYTSFLGWVVISLVLDRSGSMASDGGSTALQSAVPAFVSEFTNGLDYMSLITFADNARIDVPMTSNFQSPIDTAVSALEFDGGTFGTGAGSGPLSSTTNGPPISLADLQNNSLTLPPGSLLEKVMVYFTDGLMNIIQDTYSCGNPPPGPSNVTYNVGGYDSGVTFDFFDPTKDTWETGDLSYYYSGTNGPLGSGRGCNSSGGNGFCNGNPPYNSTYSCKGVTTFPSQQYGTGEAFSRAAITVEAQYRAIYTANQMGTETPVPTYIYVIGLGADITSGNTEAFLATLANDASGAYGNAFNPARPAGGFYPVPNCPSSTCTASLNAVFQLINARILQ